MKNLINQKFGRYLVLSLHEITNNKVKWTCLCDCGSIRSVFSTGLTSGRSKSCGCLAREQTSKRNLTHGKTKTPEYQIFAGAKARCSNSKRKEFSSYGGRGIKFLFSSFEQFLEVLGPRPDSSFSLERINNDGNYEPGNVKWATKSEQQNNKSTNKVIVIGDQSHTLTEWAIKNSIKPTTALSRINRCNWCEVCAVSIKPNAGRCTHTT